MEAAEADTQQRTNRRVGYLGSDKHTRHPSKRVPENPDAKSRTEEAEKLIKKTNQELFRIAEKIKEKRAIARPSYRMGYGWEFNKEQRPKQAELDKLTFANGAYREKAVISYSSGEPEINIHNLHYRMLHGTNNLNDERCLLKMLNPKKHAEYRPSLEALEERIRELDSRRSSFLPVCSLADRENMMREATELEWERETAFASAPVRGKVWNSLPAKKDIQKQIKLEEEKREGDFAMKKKIVSWRRGPTAAEKDLRSLEKKLEGLRQRKQRALR